MSISLKIHSIDTASRACIVTIKDDNYVIVDKKNIGLELNPDGTANTDHIVYKTKIKVKQSRSANLENGVTISSHPHLVSIGE